MNRRLVIASSMSLALVASLAAQAKKPVHAAAPTSTAATPSAAASTSTAPAKDLRFAVLGDFGVDDEREAAVARLIASWEPDFIVTTGDDNYPNGDAATIDQNIGKHFAAFIGHYKGKYGKGSEANRFWPTPGNHDWRGKEALKPYLDYFTLPGNGRYYDVLLAEGKVHLFALDSDKHEPDGIDAASAQAKWAEAGMRASKACLKIAAFHHPPYSSSVHGSSMELRWPFAAWGADIVFSGHDHAYERSVANGIQYVVTGLGGASTYPFKSVTPESQVRFNDDVGAALITLTKGKAVIEFWTVHGKLVDHVEVPKSCL
ncbi:MAG: metallophosphoesterase [Deltaproteobacteria bacterium]|nr:metallophosphoesterase [Deltaproteobacteria bacterium]